MLRTDIIQKALVIRPDNKILILRRTESDTRRPLQWDLPGGLLEPNEPLEAGIIRELVEETAIEAAHVRPIYTKTEIRKWPTGEASALFIFYAIKTKVEEVTLSNEHDKYEWVSLEEAVEKFEYYLHKELFEYVINNQLEL